MDKLETIPYVDLDNYNINLDVVTLISEKIVRKYNLIAIDKKDKNLIVAMADPLNIVALDDIKLYLKIEVKPVISREETIINYINKYYNKEITTKVLKEFEESYIPLNIENMSEEEIKIKSAPVVKLLNSIIEQAITDQSSDIHIEPYEDSVRIRLRIDGELKEMMNLSKNSLSSIVTRIKIMAKMDIAEQRLPQDGRVEIRINNKDVDMRISSMPTVYGEKIVIRLLDRSNFIYEKNTLGFSEGDLKIINKILAQPQGIVLIVGPTGSGKSTTLTTILQEINNTEKNIITIEDPVEYKLKGINQVQVNYKTGLTFSLGLRSILRQDPDVIMIGEIRDSDTARIAIRAAITGHLVLSTLHTNDSPSTITRLVDMGVEPYLLASAISGIVSQRLIKLLCEKCKESYEASFLEKRVLGLRENKKIYLNKAVGCDFCNKGYKGRLAVYELMPISENIKRLIESNSSINKLKDKAREEGMTSILESASIVAINGKTSYEEVMRVGFTL